jgi:hypothetical protein
MTIHTESPDNKSFELPSTGELTIRDRIEYASEGEYSYKIEGRFCYVTSPCGSGTSFYTWQLARAIASGKASIA